jgi:hypothetical protein
MFFTGGGVCSGGRLVCCALAACSVKARSVVQSVNCSVRFGKSFLPAENDNGASGVKENRTTFSESANLQL